MNNIKNSNYGRQNKCNANNINRKWRKLVQQKVINNCLQQFLVALRSTVTVINEGI